MTTHQALSALLYLRVSTDKQDTIAQRQQCMEYALARSLPIGHALSDMQSGGIPWRDRTLGSALLENNTFTDLVVYEFSRIGRDLVDTLEFLKWCTEHSITVHVVKSGMVLRSDISGKIMSTVLGLAAEIEREMIRTRTRDALAVRQKKIREEGGFISASGRHVRKLGRPSGSVSDSKLFAHKDDIHRLDRAGVAVAAIARIYKCDARTVSKFLTTTKED